MDDTTPWWDTPVDHYLAHSRFCVIDTETTGLTPEDRLVEVAAVIFEEGRPFDSFETLVNPRMPINPEASAAHFITQADLTGAPFVEEIAGMLRQFVGDLPLVAHNAPFDREHLPMLADKTWICSYRFARHLWPQAPSYRNQVLRYWLGLDAPWLKGVGAHRAHGDCLVTGTLFARQLKSFQSRFNATATMNDVAEFVGAPVRVERFGYGAKHRGAIIPDIPTSYLEWIVADSVAEERRLNVDADTMAAVRFELLQRRNAQAA